MIVWMCLEQEESQSVIDVSDTKQNKSDSDEESTSNYYRGKRFHHKISLKANRNCILLLSVEMQTAFKESYF